MKSIGLCVGLFVIAMAIVVWVRPGGESVAGGDPLAASNTPTELVNSTPVKVDSVAEEAPVTQEPVDQEPTAQKPVTQEPVAQKPVTQEPVDPRTKGVVIKKSSAAARAKGEITFDDLKFEIEKDAPFSEEMLDDDVKSLDGLNVRLNGYILPATLYKETNIDQFVLVRDNQECCFGPGAALFDCVIVEMQDGNTTDFVTRPVTVHGKLKLDTEKYKYPGGKGPRGDASHFAIFRLEGLKVK